MVTEHDTPTEETNLLDLVRTGAWLDAQEFPPTQWAVPGLIPEGFGLLTGPPKIGKSWLALGIGLSVAAGGRALGKVATGQPRPVLYLALEDGYRRLQHRSRHLLVDEPIPDDLHTVTDLEGHSPIRLIETWLKVHGDRRPVVLLDTLGRVMPPAMPGESAYGRDYRIGVVLKRLVDAHPGATLLVVHHVRKQTAEDWMDSTSGTNGLNGAADFTLNLSRKRNDDSGTLRVTGRDVAESEYAVTTVDGSWSLDGADLHESAQVATETRLTENLGDDTASIVQLARKHPEGIRAADVVRELELAPDKARQYLKRLHDAGRLTKPETGLYRSTLHLVTSTVTPKHGVTYVTGVTPEGDLGSPPKGVVTGVGNEPETESVTPVTEVTPESHGTTDAEAKPHQPVNSEPPNLLSLPDDHSASWTCPDCGAPTEPPKRRCQPCIDALHAREGIR